MLLNASVTIAYKCSACGAFEFFDNISLFELTYKDDYKYECKCGKSAVLIKKDATRNLIINVPCISCGNSHVFVLSRKALLHNSVNILACPENGMKLCFIGNDEEVRKKIDYFEKELDELINMFGYENYFNNTQVMFDSLNHLHDIAENGELFCECGSKDIEVSLLPDKIHLRCRRCEGSRIISAASNVDLKDILSKREITLANMASNMEIIDCNSFIKSSDMIKK
ncbi:MAG: hypothetical protein Q8920_09190 [Bacillota bacterium]|nr:hypothetical protein [Bacillota bacterium]